MAAGEREVAACDVGCGVGGAGGFAEHAGLRAGVKEENRFEREVGGEAEGEAAREEEAVAGAEQDGVGDAFDSEPALAGEHGVALDAVVRHESESEIAQHGEAASHVELGLHEGEDLGERIHALGSGVDGWGDGAGGGS